MRQPTGSALQLISAEPGICNKASSPSYQKAVAAPEILAAVSGADSARLLIQGDGGVRPLQVHDSRVDCKRWPRPTRSIPRNETPRGLQSGGWDLWSWQWLSPGAVDRRARHNYGSCMPWVRDPWRTDYGRRARTAGRFRPCFEAVRRGHPSAPVDRGAAVRCPFAPAAGRDRSVFRWMPWSRRNRSWS